MVKFFWGKNGAFSKSADFVIWEASAKRRLDWQRPRHGQTVLNLAAFVAGCFGLADGLRKARVARCRHGAKGVCHKMEVKLKRWKSIR